MRSPRNTPRALGSGRRLLCCALLALLPGCQPNGPDTDFEMYLRKLGETLGVAIPATATNTPAFPPPPGEAQPDLPADSLDGLDFLALSGCAVQATILKRNSSLGRLAKPSQRLLLELEYLRLAPACITQRRGSHNDDLADALEEAWRLRRQQLPALIFNATLGSDEYRAFWLATPAPGQYPRVSRSATAAALSTINHHTRRWLGGDYQAQNRDLEILLSEVAGGDGGALLQARTAAADRRCHQLLPPIATLEAQLTAALPQRYRSWMEARNQHLVQLASAPHPHQERLRLVQQLCAPE